MNLWPRLLFVGIAGFLIGEAQTAHPWLAIVCLCPLILTLYAPLPTQDGRPGAPPGPLASAGLGALAYATASTYGWGIGQYGWTIYMAGMVYLSLGGALFGLLASGFTRAPSRPLRVVGLTAAWVLVEYSKTLGSASYPVLMGAGLGEYPIFSQLASIGGPWLMAAFVAATGALFAEAIEAKLLHHHPWLPKGRAFAWFAAALLVILANGLGGALRLHLGGPTGVALWNPAQPSPAPPEPYITVSALQGGVPTWYYRRSLFLKRLQQGVDADYAALMEEAIQSQPWGKDPQWIIFPEASLNRNLERSQRVVQNLDMLHNRRFGQDTTVLLGTTTTLDPPDPDYPAATRENTLMVLVPDQEGRLQLKDSVAKRRLVPIAETQYRPQSSWRPLATPQAKVGVMICYESMYPEVAAAFDDIDLLLVAANDAGLRWSYAARIHNRLSILRAVETGRSLVLAGQSGYTFMVDPYGRRTAEMDLFERGHLTAAVSTKRVFTIYSVLGELWVALAAAIWAFSLFFIHRTRRKSAPYESANKT